MINIEMYNVKSKLVGLKDLPHQILNEVLFSCSYVKKAFGVKPTRKYLLDINSGITYTGLLSYIVPILKKYGIKYNINDHRVKPEKKYNWRIVNNFTMRDYQKRIVDTAIAKHRCIFSSCTSSGKTFMMANMIIAFGVKTVVISPKASLSVQLQREFNKFLGVKIGIANGNIIDIENTDIIVGTPQTLLNNPEIVQNAEAILVDEFHNEPSNILFTLTAMARNAYYRIGVSATPWRDDGTDIFMVATFNRRNPKDTISASELINNGTLTPVDITFFNCDSKCDWLGDYATTYNKAIVNNDDRNKKVIQLAIQHMNMNHPTLILISKMTHGLNLLKLLRSQYRNDNHVITYNNKDYTINTIEFVSGRDSIERREAVFEAIRKNICKCMIASTIADEGLDITNLQCLIMAQGGKSSTRLFQRVGRVIRKYPGKEKSYVYDFMDSNDTMNLHSQTRLALMRMEPAWKIKIADL